VQASESDVASPNCAWQFHVVVRRVELAAASVPKRRPRLSIKGRFNNVCRVPHPFRAANEWVLHPCDFHPSPGWETTSPEHTVFITMGS